MRRPKMFRNLAVFYLFLVPLCGVSAEEDSVPSETVADPIGEEEQEIHTVGNLVEDAIDKFTIQAQIAMKTKDTEPDEESNMLNQLEKFLTQIMNLMKYHSNVYKFIEAKGIDRVIMPNLHMQHTELRAQLLKLTQMLFNVAPTTTSVMIPIGVLDIFLYAWLSDNPKVQARLMTIKGLELEPFYEQAHKLDVTIIQTQLKLFSKIIKEHIKARVDGKKTEPSKINYYKNIVLIERLSTARICHGLFDIFQLIWEYGEKNKDFMVPVFEILTDVHPYCTDTLIGRPKTLTLMSEMHEHVKRADENAKDFYEQLGLNTTNLEIILQKYIDRLQSKDEL